MSGIADIFNISIKISAIPLMLHTSEITDIFYTFDEIHLVNILYFLNLTQNICFDLHQNQKLKGIYYELSQNKP